MRPRSHDYLGGTPAIEQLFARFYEHVRDDAVLAPIFAHMSPAHVIHSQPGAAAVENAPMPVWGWGVPGGPYRPE